MDSKGQRGPPASGEGSLLLSVSPDPVPFLPSGVTFSFFWKTQGEASRPTPFAYGGQVISDGFRVCSSGGKGSVELYTRENAMTWEATFSPPGKGPAWPWQSGLARGRRTGEGRVLQPGACAPSTPAVRLPQVAWCVVSTAVS